VAVSLAALAAGSLPWLIPSLLHTAVRRPGWRGRVRVPGRHALRHRRSLVMLGGCGTAATVPRATVAPGPRSGWPWRWPPGRLRAARSRAGRWPGLTVAALVSLVIACIGITEPGARPAPRRDQRWPAFAICVTPSSRRALALAEAIGFGSQWPGACGPGRSVQKIMPNGRPTTPPSPPRPTPGLALGVPALVTPARAAARGWPGGRPATAAGLVPGQFPAAARHHRRQPRPGACSCLPGSRTGPRCGPRRDDARRLAPAGVAPGSSGTTARGGHTGVGNQALAPDTPRPGGWIVSSARLPDDPRGCGRPASGFVVVDARRSARRIRRTRETRDGSPAARRHRALQPA